MPLKQFNLWISLKERLHYKQHEPPYVSEGEIWWASVGENIGSEINGKSTLFSRPVIIYKKLSRSFYLVIPTTTSRKWEVGTFLLCIKEYLCVLVCINCELLIIGVYPAN